MTSRGRRHVVAGAVGVALAATVVTSCYAAASAAETIEVGTPEELTEALAAAQPGDTISLAPGAYDGEFVATAQGDADAPITLTGPREAVLSNSGGGYGLHLDGAAYWNLTGFAVADAGKGIVLDGTSNSVLDDVEVSDTGDEAVHFRKSSSDNVIKNSVIHDTGKKQPQYGEAIYFGSAKSNWDKYGEDDGKGPDRSDRNQALNNQLGPNVTAEHLDIKEGTVDGVVSGNSFDGHGISGENYADSWVDAKGSGYVIKGNNGTYDGDGALLDGYQTHTILDDWGCGNEFAGNTSDLGGAEGYGFNVTNQSDCESAPNVVRADNTVENAGSGLSNIEPTR